MKLFASLDPKDRKLLIGCISAVVVLAVIIALFARDEDRDDNPLPSTYLTGRHGARAAFEMLQANGYNVERWEHPLSELAAKTDTQTVVIFAEPNPTSPEDFKAVEDIAAGFAAAARFADAFRRVALFAALLFGWAVRWLRMAM